MKIAYFGTPEFSAQMLEGILKLAPEYDAEIVAVISQPDRPIGRKQILEPTPVKLVAETHGISVFQPEKLKNNTEFATTLRNMNLNFIVVVAYGKIIPLDILEIPQFGSVNIHGSILPKYRGASPVQSAIADGNSMTGLTIMYMSEGMDEGDILKIEEITIDNVDTSEDMFKKFIQIGPKLLLDTLSQIQSDSIVPTPQDSQEATYCSKISREDGEVFFQQQRAQEIYNLHRAYTPWPGIFTYFDEKRLQLEEVSLPDDVQDIDGQVGSFVKLGKNRYGIITSDRSILEILRVKPEGKKSMDIVSFVNGNQDVMGYSFS